MHCPGSHSLVVFDPLFFLSLFQNTFHYPFLRQRTNQLDIVQKCELIWKKRWRDVCGRSKVPRLVESIANNGIHFTSRHWMFPKHAVQTYSIVPAPRLINPPSWATIRESCPLLEIKFFLSNAVFPYLDITSGTVPILPYSSSFL